MQSLLLAWLPPEAHALLRRAVTLRYAKVTNGKRCLPRFDNGIALVTVPHLFG